MSEERPRLLVTGGAGYVAQLIIPMLRARYRLRLVDLKPQTSEVGDEIVQADICDLGLMTEACRDVVGVVHLAAQAGDDDFLSALVPHNVVGVWSIFEAAVRAGVSHFVFASTGQTMRANPPGTTLTTDLPPRPISVYACTKLFGEAIARYHADHHDLRVACLRIGWVSPADSPLFATEPALPGLWCGPQDLAALILAALASDVRFATVAAVSPPGTERFDVSNPYGWQPSQTAELRLRRVAVLDRLRRSRSRTVDP